MTALSIDDRHFLLRRLHSLAGIIPLGGFLLFHFFENAAARNGAQAFNKTVAAISQLPYLYSVEILLLLLPLFFHGAYGLLITAPSRPNVLNYSFARNWAYFLQRASGVLAFLYIGYHSISTRGWAVFVKGADFSFADMQAHLASPMVLAFYIAGILATCYHFTNGLWGFAITWGIIISYEAQEKFALVCTVLFFLLSIAGLDILSAFVLHEPALSQAGRALLSLLSG